MKNIIKDLCLRNRKDLLMVFLTMPFLYSAQLFHRSAVVFDLNTGIEFYNTTQTYKINRAGFSGDTSVSGQAGNANVSLGIEIGLSKRFGIGIRGKANSFFEDVDNVTSKTTSMRSNDLLLMFNFHPIVRKKLDVITGADIGLSGSSIKIDDLNNTVMNAKGTFFSLYINPRFYFKRFGFNLKTYMPFVSYGNLKSDGSDTQKIFMQKWTGRGFGVTLGIQVKI
jgi:hypothetical protein